MGTPPAPYLADHSLSNMLLRKALRVPVVEEARNGIIHAAYLPLTICLIVVTIKS
jgi:hypothetical protein